MILLQLDTADDVRRFFDTTPDTVYGLLVGGMAVVIIALWVAYQLQAKNHAKALEGYMKQLINLNVSSVETLKDLSSNLVGLRDAGVNMTEDVKERIDRTREHIDMKINTLVQHLPIPNNSKDESDRSS